MMSEAEIKAVAEEHARNFMVAYNAGQTVVELFSPSCEMLPPEMPASKGREGVQKTQDATMAQGYVSANLAVEEIVVLGANSFYTTFRCVLSKKDGSERHGKGLYVWKKTGEKYLIEVNIWNYDD